MHHLSTSRKIFNIMNYTFLISLSFLCILPLVHIAAVSLSDGAATAAGLVTFWPIEFNINSYLYVFQKPQFLHSFTVTFQRVFLGLIINMLLTILTAYPLSKETKVFQFRTIYVWCFVFTILFSGGLIPWYMTIKWTGLLDTVWALILPGAVPVFNIILLLNFFRSLPKELEESSFIDGASHWIMMWKIYVPLSLPALATISLFTIVGHWNAWFDGLILMNSPTNYPLSSYLQTVLIASNMVVSGVTDLQGLKDVTNHTAKAAQIFLGALPVMIIYPFLQKYFVKGIILGSVKG